MIYARGKLCRRVARFARKPAIELSLFLFLGAHQLLRLYLLAETLELLQRRLLFPQVLAEELRDLGMLHPLGHVDQRFVLADLVSFALDSGTDVEHVDEVFGGILLSERFFLRDEPPQTETFCLF